MKSFLQRFALLVSGVLQGFDRLVFGGKLVQLYCPEGMHTLLTLNHVQLAVSLNVMRRGSRRRFK